MYCRLFGYLARVFGRRDVKISAQISWLENVACSSHELALTQPDLLQKWLENPQTTADLEVFRLQSQRLFWLCVLKKPSNDWEPKQMHSTYFHSVHVDRLFSQISQMQMIFYIKGPPLSSGQLRSPCFFLQDVFAWRWKFQRWTTWLCDLTLLSPRRKQLCSLCTTMSFFFFCSDQWRVTEGEGCLHPDGRWFKTKGGNEFTREEDWN